MITCCTPATETRSAAPAAPAPPSAVKPRYAVDGSDEAYEVRVELPGVPKDGITVDLDENVLTLRAKRKASAQEGWKTLHREMSDLDFILRLRLNAQVDESKMSAGLDNGVLTLRLPVKEAAKPRRIEVQ